MLSTCARCNRSYFSLEEELRSELVKPKNLTLVEDRLHLYGNSPKIAVDYPIGQEKIDLLCYTQKDLVIIELKPFEADYRAYAQDINYIIQLKKLTTFMNKYEIVRGIIIAHHISKGLIDFANLTLDCRDKFPRIDLKEYFIDGDGQLKIENYE